MTATEFLSYRSYHYYCSLHSGHGFDGTPSWDMAVVALASAGLQQVEHREQ